MSEENTYDGCMIDTSNVRSFGQFSMDKHGSLQFGYGVELRGNTISSVFYSDGKKSILDITEMMRSAGFGYLGALQAEVEQLKAANQHWHVRIEQMKSQIENHESCEMDSKRLVWLIARAEDYDGHVCFPEIRYRNGLQDGAIASTARAAIDAAMAESQPQPLAKICPRPFRGRPDDFTVQQCISAGECGCGASQPLGDSHGS
jgi:hypothetical protein